MAVTIKGWLRAGGFAGSDVVAALPPALVHLRTFRVSALPPAEMEATLLRRAREGAPFGEAERAHVDALPVGEVRQGRDAREEYVSAATREADVRAFLDAFGGGVAVRSLQAEPYAIYRSVAGAAVCVDADTTHAVVHAGESETLVLVGTGPRLRVLRRIETGADHLDGAVARKLSVTPAEARGLRRRQSGDVSTTAVARSVAAAMADATRAMIEEVAHEAAMCVRYHSVSFRQPSAASLRLLGCGAADRQLQSLLQMTTGLPIDAGSVFTGFAGNPPVDDGGWATALGLALTFAPALPPRTSPNSCAVECTAAAAE